MKMSKKAKGFIIGGVGFLASVIGIFVFFTGKNLPDFFHAKPAIAQPHAVGEIVHFGKWDWRVLDIQDGKALLITNHIIDQRPYNDYQWIEGTDITWETCTLRAYLNGEFLGNFTAEERAKIFATENVNLDNQWYGSTGGRNTTDKVFLLSIGEVVKYFGDSGQLKSKNQDKCWIDDQYNDERTAKFNNVEFGWWLRSPGYGYGNAAHIGSGVYPVGSIVLIGGMFTVNFGVRPALWLKLD